MPKANAFMIFLQEWKQREQSRGNCKSMSMGELTEKAGQLWAALSEEEKMAYKQRASGTDRPIKPVATKIMSSQGLVVHELEQKKQEKERRLSEIQEAILLQIECAKANNEVPELIFHVLDMNFYCQHLSCNRWIPAELAIQKFSLNEGLIDALHYIINPQKLPLGTKADAKEISEKTHKLPPPPNAIGETNLEVINGAVQEFVFDASKKCPAPLYVPMADMEKLQSGIDDLNAENAAKKIQVELWPAEYLLVALKKTAEFKDEPSYFSASLAESVLKRTTYDGFASEFACDFHKVDAELYCCLSRAKRLATMIIDNTAIGFGVKLRPGKQLPAGSVVDLPQSTQTTLTDSMQQLSLERSLEVTQGSVTTVDESKEVDLSEVAVETTFESLPFLRFAKTRVVAHFPQKNEESTDDVKPQAEPKEEEEEKQGEDFEPVPITRNPSLARSSAFRGRSRGFHFSHRDAANKDGQKPEEPEE